MKWREWEVIPHVCWFFNILKNAQRKFLCVFFFCDMHNNITITWLYHNNTNKETKNNKRVTTINNSHERIPRGAEESCGSCGCPCGSSFSSSYYWKECPHQDFVSFYFKHFFILCLIFRYAFMYFYYFTQFWLTCVLFFFIKRKSKLKKYLIIALYYKFTLNFINFNFILLKYYNAPSSLLLNFLFIYYWSCYHQREVFDIKRYDVPTPILKFVPLEGHVPLKKDKRPNYESYLFFLQIIISKQLIVIILTKITYVPNGILKANWMHKHKNVLPAVIALMCNWDTSNWKENETDICNQISIVQYD